MAESEDFLDQSDLKPPLQWQTATRGLRWATVCACIALVFAILAGAAWQVWHLRSSEMDSARHTAATHSLQLAEHTARLFQAADLILRSTDDFLRLAPASRLADTAGMNLMLREKIAGVPEVQGHTVFGTDGVPLFSSRPDIPRVSFADRAYFRVQQQSRSAGLFVSELRANRADGKSSIFMSRRVNRPNGGFGGVIGVTIEPTYLERLYQSESPGGAYTIRLINYGGQVLASDPALRVGGASGSRGSQETGGSNRRVPASIASVHPVAGYPLRLEVSADEETVLAEWRRTALLIMACAAVAAATIVLLTWLLYRGLTVVERGRRKLWKSEATLRLIFDTVPLGIQIKDLAGRLLMINPALAQAADVAPDQILGRTAHELTSLERMPDEERRIILETDAQAVKARAPVEFDMDRKFQGGTRKLRIIKAPIQDVHGSVSGLLSIVEDVTEKARIRRELEDNRKLLQRVIDNLPQAITVKDREGRYTLANAVAARFRGVTPEQYIGKSAKDMGQIPEHIRLLEDADRQVLQTGDMRIIPEMKFTGAGGKEVWRRTFKVPLANESGAVQGILTVHEDLSAIKQIEAKRMDLERRMAQSRKLESLGVMAGGIAHDFNNLLTTISGSAELLVNGLPPNDALGSDAKTIVHASQVMAEMIRQMLTFSENGRLLLQRVDLNSVLRGLGGPLSVSIPKHIDTRYQLASGLPAVEGDPSQLNRVVANLVANAVEAIGEAPGIVTLSTGVIQIDETHAGAADSRLHLAKGEYVYFQVADTGIGMAESVKTRIFEPFFSTKFKGRGLGMAAANGIIRSHQGAIVIDSEPRRGASVRVLLPRAKSEGSSEGSLGLDLLPSDPAGNTWN